MIEMLPRRVFVVLVPGLLAGQGTKQAGEGTKQKGWRRATEAELQSTAPPVEGALFRTEVNLIRVDAEVSGGQGPIAGLSLADFLLFDNGKERELQSVSRDELALDVLLLFDVSGSMEAGVARVAATASDALDELRAGDRVAVMSFSNDSRLILGFTDDLDRVTSSINNQVLAEEFHGSTLIQTAVEDATQVFRNEGKPERRRALVVITDNEGQRSRRESTLLQKLWEADVAVCGLRVAPGGFQTTSWPGGGPGRRGGGLGIPGIGFPGGGIPRIPGTGRGGSGWPLRVGIEGLAEKTGGDLVDADVPNAFRDLMRRLRQRYSLFYSMPEGKPGERREVRVELAKAALAKYPGARVHCRKGYFLPGAPPETL